MTTVDLSSTRHNQSINNETSTRTYAISIEQIAYIVIGVAALLLHLWQLGERALHHDETLHAVYSWNIYTGKPYMHDPLLHGPFLYYTGALMFFLFGDNDATARLGFALFGTLLTLLPYLVRREVGRPAALLASCYLLVSPGLLYMSRFARHDIYSVTFEMLIFVGIVRYASTRHARWLYLAAAAFGFMYTNQETSYLFALIVGLPLIFFFLWRVYKPAIAIMAVLAVAVAAFVFVLPGEAASGGSGNAARDDATGLIEVKEPGPIFGWGPLETSDNSYALRIRNRADNDGGKTLGENIGIYIQDIWKFFHHPAILSAIASTLIVLGVLIWLIWFQRNGSGETAWQRACTANHRVVPIYASLAHNKRWLIALGIFFTIYALFFTAMFTNLLGVITGTTGSLLYWLAQHDVQRGGQPTHYYGVQLFTYEPVALFWTIVAFVMLAIIGIRRTLARNTSADMQQPDAPDPQDPYATRPIQPDSHDQNRAPLYVPLFLAWWVLFAFFIYTWAGEKMPWLTIHITLPLTLLGSWACQRILFGDDSEHSVHPFSRPYRMLLIIFLTLFVTTSGLNYVITTVFVGATERADWPALTIVSLTMVLFLVLIFAAGINWGWRWSLSVLALCVTLVGGFYTVRNAYRLSYISGDVPREMFIYTQTSPDVPRIARRLEEISIRRTRGLHMPVLYDNETVWQWYLRNFTQARYTGPDLPAIGDEVMAVVILKENLDRSEQNRTHLKPFRQQRFPLRWWFPEDETYRLREGWNDPEQTNVSLLARMLREPFNESTLIPLWKFLMYRDPGAPLGSTDFVIAVRPDIADQVGLGTGASLSGE